MASLDLTIWSTKFLASYFFCLRQVRSFEQAQNCLLPMGITSENVAHRFGVTRQEQDQAAVSL